ncbi:MAG: DUF87 domain-containing protein [Deltaproteobacteria bacterium]|nr:MAG: DUF87 domain-containing protein [Deltaproteobacteria bacterium]
MAMERLFLGTNFDTARLIYTTGEQRSTHMQVIGSTGTGKSKFLEHLIREDIRAGNGLCLIDPHGYLYNDILKWLDAIKWPTDKIILFDPSENTYTTGFNPLRLTAKDLSYQVDAMVKACAKVWGGEDTDRTPLLKRCLRITFHALAEAGLTLLETQHLTSPTKKAAREFITSDIKDPIIKEQWDYFNSEKLTITRFYEEFGSTINRLMEFLAAERIRMIIGQKDSTLNFEKIMNEGYVLLVNLSSGRSVSSDNARLLGTLLVNDLFLTATERPPKSKPFYLYIDECSLFINEDIGRILDEGRKFGFHLILAHQHLAQLKKAGEEIYHSVMTDAKTKVVFGGLSPEDAKILAELMFLEEIDLDEHKHSLDKPTVVGYTTTWLKNYSRTESSTEIHTEARATSRTTAESRSKGEARGSTSGVSSGMTYTADGLLFDLNRVVSRGEMSSESAVSSQMRGYTEAESQMESESEGTGYGTAESRGESEALLPILEYVPSATYSLQDQIFKAMRVLVSQPTRHAVVKLPGMLTKKMRVPMVKESIRSSDEAAIRYRKKCYQGSEYNQLVKAARQEIAQRQQLLLEHIQQYKLKKEEAKDKEPAYRQPKKKLKEEPKK